MNLSKNMTLNQQEIQQLNEFEKFLSWQRIWAYDRYLHMPNKFIFLCTGNQAMKTSSTAHQYVRRILGSHPVPKKNLLYFECASRNKDNPKPHGLYKKRLRIEGKEYDVDSWEKGTWNIYTKPEDDKCPYCGEDIVIHKRGSRVFRFCSETLPGEKETIDGSDGGSAEVKNTVYPEFKKWLPPFLIKKDITFRSYAMILKDPWAGQVLLRDEVYEGMDSVVEFVSYSQSVQATAGSQKCSVWEDEEPPKDFHDEQIPRLLVEDGDIVISLTPAYNMSWTFDSVFEQACIYIRTKAVCDALSTENEPLDRIQTTDSNFDIGVIQAATDDNPILGQDAIDALFETIDDPDVMMTRRYGVHKQASGRVFKDFDWRVHVIDGEKYFPTGLFHDWRFVRMIDYHEKNPWACTWVALNPFNEAFVFQEFSPSPEKMVTREISHSLADLSDDFKYSINLIDPLANKIQSNTGTTVMEDINTYFREFKREDNYPGFTGGYWESWDTKSTRGRDEIRRRLKWAKKCKVPFNNKIEGTQRYAPTLWIFKDCKEVARSLKQWRYTEWSDRASRVNKDSSEQVSQKFSHYCMCLEAIFKDKRFRPPMNNTFVAKKPKYFQGRAA